MVPKMPSGPWLLEEKGICFVATMKQQRDAAIMYSLLGCCKVCDVNPREWLTDEFTRIPRYNNNYDLDLADLLPHIWEKSNDCQNFPESSN